MTVLIVDDHELNRMILKHILKKLGLLADTAENGLEAIEATRSKSYELIFMDIQMPMMDGITAAQHILTSMVPPPRIVAVTANTEDKQKCMDAGMADFIAKPVTLSRIKKSLSAKTV